jgi:demethylmenaquinone methyltransferase/2-methoxy-6-polyprenyl-1,4-benzoquinol methylase
VLGSDGTLPEGPDKRRAVEAMFDRVAPGYDRMNRVISLGLDRRWRRRAIGVLSLPRDARVLDVACGTGDLCEDLASVGHHATGIDLSEGMLAAARTTAPLVRGDAEALPFRDGAFDGVVCGFALRNFVDLTMVLVACARVVRPGGRFAAVDAAVPANPLMRAGNALWFRGAVPLLGRLLSRDPEAYRYLPRSTAYLPSPAELVEQLRRAGFADVERTTMTGGSVQLLTGTRT